MGKRVITFKNSQPQNAIIDICDSAELSPALNQILDDEQLGKNIEQYITQVHPYQDGDSASRVLDAVDDVANLGLKPKPLNLMRKFKLRKNQIPMCLLNNLHHLINSII